MNRFEYVFFSKRLRFHKENNIICKHSLSLSHLFKNCWSLVYFSSPELAQGELLGSLNVCRLTSVVHPHLFVNTLAVHFWLNHHQTWSGCLFR
jgi:hypothetical protein